MKKYQNILLMIFFVVSISFTTIAYAGLSQRMGITAEAEFRVPADIRVTGINIGQTNGNTYNYTPKYTLDTITMGFNLAANTSITYNVTVRNSGDIDQTIYDMTTVSTNNQGVTCSLTGYNKKDVIGYRDSVTFGVTCTSAAETNNTNIVLKFDFRKVYYVSYNANGGTNAPSEQIKYENEDLEITSEEPTRTNYSFIGWSDTSNAQTAQYEPGDTYTLNSDKVLYAVWEANTHTVTYNKTTNGGTGENIQETVSYNQSIDLTKTASKTGWTFVGWNTNSSATTALPNLTMGEQDITLYAIYSKQLTGTFNYYNGESTSVSTTIYNTETSGTITAPGALGGDTTYIFRGWSESNLANASNPLLANTSITLSENKTYYASYTYTVTVTWTANGGSTPAKTEETKNAYMNYQGSKVGISFTMPAGTTKTGYTFNGWGTSNYAASSSQTFTANQTLAAQWTVNQYSLTYDVTTNGGTGTNDTVIYDYNESVDLTKTASKTGYTFVGWNTDSTATTALSTYQMPAETSILYAIFTPNTYTVTFDENKNLLYGLDDTSVAVHDTFMNYTISSGNVTVTAENQYGYGYTEGKVYLEADKKYIFNCDKDSSEWGIIAGDGSIIAFLTKDKDENNSSNILRMESNTNYEFTPTITGVYWLRLDVHEQGKVSVFSNISVKEKPTQTKTVTYDSTYGTLPEPTRIGYTFNGWNGKNLLNMTEWLDSFNTVNRGTATKDNNSVTITATSSDAYTLTYHYMPNYYGYKIPVNANKTYTLSWNTDNQNVDGNVFVFLNDSQENSDIFYTDHKNKKITFTTTSNTKYITFRIGVSSAGSSITYSNIQLEEGSTATTYEPYYVTSSTTVTQAKNHTLTAIWEKNAYVVTFDPDGGSVTPAAKVVTYDEPYGELPTPTKDGYSFNGWNGKNMFNQDKILMAISDATYSDGYYHFHPIKAYDIYSNGISDSDLTFKPLTQYTLKFVAHTDYIESANSQQALYVGFTYTDGTTSLIGYNGASDGERILTSDSGKTVSKIIMSYGHSHANANVHVKYIQLEEGSTATAYEPYYVTSSTKVVQPANHTLTAVWEPNTYRVTYEGNGATHLANSNLVAKYDALYHNGNTILDISGNNRNGTASNVIFGSDYMQFNGTTSWVNLGPVHSNYQTLEVTFEKTSYTTGNIIGNWESGGGGIYLNDERKICGNYYISGSGYYSVVSTTQFSLNKKNHVALTYDGSVLKLYVNGKLEASTSVSGVIGAPSSNTVMALGTNPSGNNATGAFVSGKIYNAAIYNTALSAEQIAQDAGKDVTYDSTYGTLPTPQRNGYTFKGWNGKNYFNINKCNNITNGVTKDSSDWITVNTSSGVEYYNFYTENLNIEEGKTYQIVVELRNTSNVTGTLYITSDQPGYSNQFESKEIDPDSLNSNEILIYNITSRDNPTGPNQGLRTFYHNLYRNTNETLTFRISVLDVSENITEDNFEYEPYYVTSDTKVTQAKDHTLTAEWEINQSTITLDPKFYTSSSASSASVTPTTSGTTSITSKYNTSLSPTSISMPYTSTLSATNGTIYAITYNNIKYGFEGYYEGKACTGTQRIKADGTYVNFTNTTYTSNTTLYACWKKINAGADISASHVSYTCTASSGCPSSSINTVQKALDDLASKFSGN